MNCDGSSTASHSTPEMPDTPSSSTTVSMVQAVAEFVEQGDHFIVGEQRRLAWPSTTAGSVKLQVR
jgi:hypothetical protein